MDDVKTTCAIFFTLTFRKDWSTKSAIIKLSTLLKIIWIGQNSKKNTEFLLGYRVLKFHVASYRCHDYRRLRETFKIYFRLIEL